MPLTPRRHRRYPRRGQGPLWIRQSDQKLRLDPKMSGLRTSNPRGRCHSAENNILFNMRRPRAERTIGEARSPRTCTTQRISRQSPRPLTQRGSSRINHGMLKEDNPPRHPPTKTLLRSTTRIMGDKSYCPLVVLGRP